MTTYKVSTQSQLKSALNSAKGGDTISLGSGDYGSLYLDGKKYGGAVKITSASASNEARFDKISLNNVSNLTFDNVDVQGSTSNGHGVGSGVRVNSSSNVTFQNMELKDLAKGLQAWNDSNLKLINNTFNNISYDGVVVGHSRTVLIQGNDINMQNGYGDIHRDGIQFYNQGTVAPSSNVTIRNNQISTEDGVTHGMYLGNYDGNRGQSGEAYTNFTIEGNRIETAQTLGLALSTASNVSIRNNIVIQTDEYYSKKAVNIPMILVDNNAKNVSLSGNTVLKAPVIADEAGNWQPITTIANSGSKIVSLGAAISSASVASASAEATTLSAESATTTSSTTTSSAVSAGDGDLFRFMGSKVGTGLTEKAAVDLGHDVVVLSNYESGTFGQVKGGNELVVDAAGAYAKLDSLADIKELDQASKAVSAKVSGDTLILDIAQAHGTHHLELAGLGHDYLALA
jgi:hypothetical protein